MHGVSDMASLNWKDSVAGFMRPFVHLEPLAAEREHLGHERHAVYASILVQRAQNIFLAAHFDPVSHAQF